MNNSDQVYQQLLEKTLDRLQKQISDLERKNKGLRALTDKTAYDIEGYKNEYNDIVNTLKQYQARQEHSAIVESVLNRQDKKAERIISKQQARQDKINQLATLGQQATSARYQRKINKMITRQQKKIRSLNKKHIRLNKRQRVIMLPKYYLTKRRNSLLFRQQGKVHVVEENIKDLALLKAHLNPENSIIDRLKSTIYDIKGNHYQNKLSRQQEILKNMQQHKYAVAIRGARAVAMPKRAIRNLRNKFTKEIENTKENTPEKETVTTNISDLLKNQEVITQDNMFQNINSNTTNLIENNTIDNKNEEEPRIEEVTPIKEETAESLVNQIAQEPVRKEANPKLVPVIR